MASKKELEERIERLEKAMGYIYGGMKGKKTDQTDDPWWFIGVGLEIGDNLRNSVEVTKRLAMLFDHLGLEVVHINPAPTEKIVKKKGKK